MSAMKVIDLFCGAGGLSAGLQQAGFQVLAGNDFDKAAGRTFAATHPDAVFLGGSIRDLSPDDFLRAAGIKKGELDCLVGGPPCQGYSVYNHKRGMDDERSHLFREYLRIVEGLMPRYLVMENVTGIMSAGEGEAFQGVLKGIRDLGYEVEARILRAEDYGIPQERRRVVFLANRVGAPIFWPEKTHGEGMLPFTSIRDALGDLPPLLNGEDNGVTGYGTPAKSDYQKLLRRGANAVYNHSASRLGAINVERMAHIPPGGSWRDIPFELLPAGMKRAKRSDHTKRYGRLHWDRMSGTILTKCDVHWGAYIHPEQDRSITVREAARIQSFPDSFHFHGSRTEQYVQVGNAVPPLLGKRIGEAVLQSERERAADADPQRLAV